MNSTILDPQMIDVLRKQKELVPTKRDVSQLSPREIRHLYNLDRVYWNSESPELPSVTELRVPGPAGEITLRCYLPETNRELPVLVYLHGGGWIMGNLDTHDRIIRTLALRSGTAIVGVDYRLAPEYKFPVALNETLAVLAHLEAHGSSLGIDCNRLALGGDSAGANMAVSATQIRNATVPNKVRYLLLYYGGYGLRDSRSRRLFGSQEDGMGQNDLDYYRRCYFRNSEDETDLRFNVLDGNIAALPPAFVVAAEYDPLRDDSLALKEHMDQAGVSNELQVVKGVLHGFLHYSRTLDKAASALIDGAAALRRALA